MFPMSCQSARPPLQPRHGRPLVAVLVLGLVLVLVFVLVLVLVRFRVPFLLVLFQIFSNNNAKVVSSVVVANVVR